MHPTLTGNRPRTAAVFILVGLLAATALSLHRRQSTRKLLASLPPSPDSLELHLSAGLERLRENVARHPRDAQAWGKLGMAFHIHQFHRQALLCYETAARLEAKAFAWNYYRALALQSLGRPEAAQGLQRADTLNPDFAPLQWRLGKAALARGDFEAAKARFRGALRLNPEGYPARLALAQALAAQDSAAAADSLIGRAISDFPGYREAYALRADAQRRTGSGSGDSSWLEKPAFGSFPDPYEDSLVAMGMTSFWYQDRAERNVRKGRLHEAAREYRMALRIRPDADAFAKLGEVLARAGKTLEAERELNRGLSAYPEDANLLNTMGFLFSAQRRADEAIPWYRRAAAASPLDPAGHRNLALALAATGRLEEARKGCAEALGRLPGNRDLHQDCGVVDSLSKAAKSKPDKAKR